MEKSKVKLVTIKLKENAHKELKVASAIMGLDYSKTIMELVKLANVTSNR